MTKKRTLTDEEINMLVNLQAEYQKAKSNFENAKRKLCADLLPNTYTNSTGDCEVTKRITERALVDYKAIVLDNDVIDRCNVKLDQYTTSQEVSVISMKNFRMNN